MIFLQDNVIIKFGELFTIYFKVGKFMNDKLKNVIGIDVGGSTTKIVGFQVSPNGDKNLINPILVRATDPITSIYGAFGKFLSENDLSINDIDKVMITGVGGSHMSKPIYSLDCEKVPEFTAVALGGLYLSGLDEAIIVSMGTGTALVHAKKTDGVTEINYLGGTGIGGGTLLGLTKKMLGIHTIEHIEMIAEGGNLDNVDLRVKDISKDAEYTGVNENLTAANFGKLSDLADQSDIALGLANMVAETIAMIAIFAARGRNIKDIVLVGNLTSIKPVREVFMNLKDDFGVNFIIPENATFGTVMGAALSMSEKL